MKKLLSIASIFFISFSAMGQDWTWVAGADTTGVLPYYGVKGAPGILNNPGARSDAVFWRDASGQVWLFGGSNSTSYTPVYNDLWKYNPTTHEWTWVSGNNNLDSKSIYGISGVSSTTNMPGARRQSMSWIDTAGNFWLFGGWGFAASNSSGFLSDLWKYNPNTNEWTWLKGDTSTFASGLYGSQTIPSSINKPCSRYRGMSWTGKDNSLWLFGGYGNGSSGGWLSDLWRYDIATNEWAWMKGDTTNNNALLNWGIYGTRGVAAPENLPGCRQNAATWVDSIGNFWLFGGFGKPEKNQVGGGNLNDLWKYDPLTNQWTWMHGDKTKNVAAVYGIKGINSPANKPGARQQASFSKDTRGHYWLHGGSSSADILNDLWEYDPAVNVWTWQGGDVTPNKAGVYGLQGISASSNKPGARASSISWADTSGHLWLFGGYGLATNTARGFLDDLWGFKIPPVVPNKIEALSKEEAVLCYPNPATNIVRIIASQEVSFQLMDFVGRALTYDLVNGEKAINVSMLSRGIYFYVAKDSAGKLISTGKVVLQ